MRKKVLSVILSCMILGLSACGTGSSESAAVEVEAVPIVEREAEAGAQASDAPEEAAAALTEEQALEAVRNYCFEIQPDLKEMVEADEETVYWDVITNEEGQIVVLYRSYTGAQIRYYIDPVTGETYTTELVPSIIDEEQRTEESLNIRDYLE